jgi:hypothetical protein
MPRKDRSNEEIVQTLHQVHGEKVAGSRTGRGVSVQADFVLKALAFPAR